MQDPRSIGALIDDLDFRQWPPPDEEVLGAVVLLKIRNQDGEVSLRSMWSDDLGWLERVGMHTVAAQTELPSSRAEPWLDEDDPPAPGLHAVDTGPEARGDSRPGTRRDAPQVDEHNA